VKVDALVVGAGPAGSSTAIHLARAGARVLLADKARFPRDKPCGGGLTGRALQHLPCAVDAVVEHVVDRMVVRVRYRAKVARKNAEPLIEMTQRRRLDLHLAEQAAAAGAEFRDGVAVSDVEVRDSGVGIPPDAIGRLFQPFHQVLAPDKRRAGGTGLGLAISQRIVEAMGSRIEIESSPGHGSRFWFSATFEVDPSETHPVPLDSSMGGLDGEVTIEGTALVVEDNDVNRMIAREVLQSLGMRVHEASNGVEALDAMDARTFDIVLMDCFMPVLDGYATAREIRRREVAESRGRMPIIAVTANAFEEDAEQAHAAGMDAHLAKPYTRAQLRDLLKTWL